jgi:putative colanic acid biosynthesis acetyltransferase WcaF
MSYTKLSSFNNNWYKPANKLKILAWYLVNHATLNTYLPIPVSIKCLILKIFGAKIGNSVFIKPKVNIKYPWFLEIGSDVWIGEEVWIDNLSEVKIENNVCLSQGAMLLTGNHNYTLSSFDLMVGKIVLEEGVWIGAKAIVCPGIKCQSHSILAVGSVATQNLEPYSIYQGNPAQLVRKRIINA